MKLRILIGLLAAFGASAAVAGDKQHNIEVKVVKSDATGDVDVHWVGDGEDFEDLAIGESKTLDEGVVVTRTAEGLDVVVEGEEIFIPHHQDDIAFAHVEAVEAVSGGILIASDAAIDEATQETIRSVLATAGYADDVHFVTSDARHVAVVEKRIKRTRSGD